MRNYFQSTFPCESLNKLTDVCDTLGGEVLCDTLGGEVLLVKVRIASFILTTSPPNLPPVSLSCTLFCCLPARSLAHFFPVLLGEKNRERHACARAKHGEARTPRYFALLLFSPPFSSLLLSLLLSCPFALVPHRHRRRTTRALPPMLRRKLQGISPPPAPPCVRPAPRFSRVQLF